MKIKNKPIKEGSKMWCLGFKGYIWSFHFHTSKDSGEGMTLSPMPSLNR